MRLLEQNSEKKNRKLNIPVPGKKLWEIPISDRTKNLRATRHKSTWGNYLKKKKKEQLYHNFKHKITSNLARNTNINVWRFKKFIHKIHFTTQQCVSTDK